VKRIDDVVVAFQCGETRGTHLESSARNTERLMRLILPLLAITALNLACAHAVRIESEPGADILVNGQRIGQSPATYTETTGTPEQVRITAKKGEREKTIVVQKNNVDVAPIGAGAAIGVGACLAGGVVTLVAAFVAPPCAFVTGPASWGALASGPLAGWYYFSHKMPDSVRVDLDDAPKVAENDATQQY
jgi:hypothetical protein